MKGRSRPTLLQIVLLVALAAFTAWITWKAKALEGSDASQGDAAPLVGKQAPDFTLRSLDGESVSLSQFRGKKSVVVAFWASWCGPCRVEMPALSAFYREKHKPESDFEILAVSIDDDPEAARVAAKEWDVAFPVLLDSAHDAAESYGVEAIPTIFVIDKSGAVKLGHTGYEMGMEIAIAENLGIQYRPFAKEQGR